MGLVTGSPKTMDSRFTLRTRFIGALLLVVTLISAGFCYAVYEFVEVLEVELMERTVKRELQELALRFVQAPDTPLTHVADLQGYVLRPGAVLPRDFPAVLLSWPAGRYEEFEISGKEFFAGREDVADARLYLVLDIAQIESLEEQLIQLSYLFVVGALLVAVIVGGLLPRLVMRPVSRLAEQLTLLDPSQTSISLRERFGDRDIGLIAAAFDRYQERLGDFVARERAFTDAASHELRTPLAIILTAVQLLQEEPRLSERSQERIARVYRAAHQMQTLIEALMFLAREDGGWQAEPCALDEVVQEVADSYRDTLANKSLILYCEIQSPRIISAPPGMVTCVVGNLVNNAIQHTEKGRIDLRLESDRIVVQDTGGGIMSADPSLIFEHRYRDPQSRGLGLGLYLVKRICDRLGWTIEVHSAPGAGARFDLIFSGVANENLTQR